MLPPGLPRLATNPSPTGSMSRAMTMGIVRVRSLAARVAKGPPVTMTSTPSRTSSAAFSRSRSTLPALHRYSMMMSFPSTYPSARRACTKPSQLAVQGPGMRPRYAMRGMARGSCASEPSDAMRRLRARITGNPMGRRAMVVSSIHACVMSILCDACERGQSKVAQFIGLCSSVKPQW